MTEPNTALLTLLSRCRVVAQFVAGFSVMTIGSLLALGVSIGTLFQCRDFCATYIIAPTARIVLRIGSIQFVVHNPEHLRKQQTVFIANHASTLDVFILTAMALPNTRFFLSGHLRKKFPPLVGKLRSDTSEIAINHWLKTRTSQGGRPHPDPRRA